MSGRVGLLQVMGAALLLAVGLFLGPAELRAATITDFKKTTNDGVFTLSQAQADFLGFPTAAYIGFYRVREGAGQIFDPGDTFTAATMFASTSNDGKILQFLNGQNPDLTYTGPAFAPLGLTTIGTPNSYFRGVAFLFAEGVGNIVFAGTATFNQGQSQGAFDGIEPPPQIPAPPSVVLLVSMALVLILLKRLRSPACPRRLDRPSA